MELFDAIVVTITVGIVGFLMSMTVHTIDKKW